MALDNQFYPTPPSLAKKAYKKFQNKNITRLLEPQAGRGDMLDPFRSAYSTWAREADCIEIDLENQMILRGKGYRVIDGDFLSFTGSGAMYSHIMMNPPFNMGVSHTLHAWDILYSGEIVSIINASNLMNSFAKTRKAQRLLMLIEDHGSVEYLDEEFMTEDTQRKTSVRVALIHLVKTRSVKEDFYTGADLQKEEGGPELTEAGNQLAIPQSTIQNTVQAFKAASRKMLEATVAEDEAKYYERFIFSHIKSDVKPPEEANLSSIQEIYNKRYDELKEGSWRAILQTTEFSDRLSSAAQKRLESEFSQIVCLEFTMENIYGLLSGLVMQKGKMDADMICDVFDLMSKYYTGNRAYYQGWKSNDKQRQGCFRLRTTRIVLPIGKAEYSVDYYKMQELRDIDKVFAMMDGKAKGKLGLEDMLSGSSLSEAKEAKRLSGDYFDLRYYKGKGTLHLYPTNKELIDRLNRVVGQTRNWLPDQDHASDPVFWNQYDKAEKVTDAMCKEMNKGQFKHSYTRDNSVTRMYEADQGEFDISKVHAEACATLKIPLPDMLESDATDQLAIEAA